MSEERRGEARPEERRGGHVRHKAINQTFDPSAPGRGTHQAILKLDYVRMIDRFQNGDLPLEVLEQFGSELFACDHFDRYRFSRML